MCTVLAARRSGLEHIALDFTCDDSTCLEALQAAGKLGHVAHERQAGTHPREQRRHRRHVPAREHALHAPEELRQLRRLLWGCGG